MNRKIIIQRMIMARIAMEEATQVMAMVLKKMMKRKKKILKLSIFITI